MPDHAFPKLRPIDPRPVTHRGRPCLHLRDPLALSDRELVIPQPLAAALAHFDGERDLEHIASAFERRHGLALPIAALRSLVDALDEACLLDNERSAQAQASALLAYRAAPHRPPACAGSTYPAGPSALRRMLNGYLAQAGDADRARPDARSVFSPHIDYARGGPVYARVWRAAQAAAQAAELAVIIGTDHYGDDPITLTRQHVATPLGVLPAARPVVDGVADAVGRDAAFRGELRHRVEHSLELPLVWLHHMRGGAPIAVVPVLVGSFHRFMHDGGDPSADPRLGAALDALGHLTRGRRTLVIASGDLAHVGPAFGGRPLGDASKARLRREDAELLGHVHAGDADGFYRAIAATRNRNNVCGTAPFFLALKLLEAARGEARGYDVCPADEAATSVVSIAGVAFE